MKTWFIFIVIAGVLLPSFGDEKSETKHPNVILIMCDDLGWGDVGFNGNKTIKTPHLDAMAKNGLVFNRFYAASAVCSPTRGSVLTGRNPIRIGVPTANAGHLRESEKTIAEHLKKRGFATGHFGKWHLGTFTKTERDSNRGGKPNQDQHFTQPTDHGYDTYFATEAKVPTFDPMIKPMNHPAKTWWDPVDQVAHQVAYGTAYWSPKGKVTNNLEGDNSRVIMDRVLPFIKKAASEEQAFFTTIWFHTPHLPVVAGPEMTKMYRGFSKYEQHYYGCISAMDLQVGRLRSTLRELGIHRNTMIWFCSDNGPEGSKNNAPGSAGHLRGRKRDLYEGGIRVPALLEWPHKIAPNQSTDLPAFTSDYLPTILEWVHIPFQETKTPLDGMSLASLIESQEENRPIPMAFQYGNKRAWIQNRFKLHVSNFNKPNPAITLFDIKSDPSESNDISNRYPLLTKHMFKSLNTWAADCIAEAQSESQTSNKK